MKKRENMRENKIVIYFINIFHHETTRKSCGGGKIQNIQFFFKISPQEKMKKEKTCTKINL